MEIYPWVVIGHVFFVIVALGAHGVSALATFQVRREPDRARLAAILDFSSMSFYTFGAGILFAIVLGVVAGLMGGHFGRLWIWAAILVLVTLIVIMIPIAGKPTARVRKALGLRSESKEPAVDPDRRPQSDEELAAARAALRPGLVAGVGLGGTLILVWLMEAKPI